LKAFSAKSRRRWLFGDGNRREAKRPSHPNDTVGKNSGELREQANLGAIGGRPWGVKPDQTQDG